jgi:activator of 2-hydroxyglutaryl-CoA dehydratase
MATKEQVETVAVVSAAPKRALVGVDIGSTTLKVVALSGIDGSDVLFEFYERHRGDLQACAQTAVERAADALAAAGYQFACCCVTGSAGIHIARRSQMPFVQEVVACATACTRTLGGSIDVAIELGGEDAKVMRFARNAAGVSGATDAKMNGTCASGTGAFIDTCASLIGTDAAGLDVLAAGAKR